ncbi:hypothetical protein D3C72_1541700 [compost metagenome]
MQFTHSTHLQISRTLSDNHRNAHHTCQQTKRIQQLEEVTGVVQTHIFIEVERNALQQVAERYADHQRWHEATDEDAPVPHVTPAGVFNLRTVVKTDRTEEQGRQYQNHRDIEAGERSCVNHRPGGKQCAARGD